MKNNPFKRFPKCSSNRRIIQEKVNVFIKWIEEQDNQVVIEEINVFYNGLWLW